MKSLATKVQRFLVSEDGPDRGRIRRYAGVDRDRVLDRHSFDWHERQHDVRKRGGLSCGANTTDAGKGQTLLADLKPTPLGSASCRGVFCWRREQGAREQGRRIASPSLLAPMLPAFPELGFHRDVTTACTRDAPVVTTASYRHDAHVFRTSC